MSHSTVWALGGSLRCAPVRSGSSQPISTAVTNGIQTCRSPIDGPSSRSIRGLPWTFKARLIRGLVSRSGCAERRRSSGCRKRRGDYGKRLQVLCQPGRVIYANIGLRRGQHSALSGASRLAGVEKKAKSRLISLFASFSAHSRPSLWAYEMQSSRLKRVLEWPPNMGRVPFVAARRRGHLIPD